MNEDVNYNAIVTWHGNLQKGANYSRLKRASTLDEIQMNEAFYELIDILDYKGNMDQMAAIVLVLSHVRCNSEWGFAELMGAKTATSEHTVSKLRFNRLIDGNRSEFARSLVRILPLIDNELNIMDVIKKIFYWGDTVKKECAKEYYIQKKNKVK